MANSENRVPRKSFHRDQTVEERRSLTESEAALALLYEAIMRIRELEKDRALLKAIISTTCVGSSALEKAVDENLSAINSYFDEAVKLYNVSGVKDAQVENYLRQLMFRLSL